MLSDFRFAIRQLVKAPGFTAIAILTLALGIGLNTAMFSLMNLLVLRPLPYPDTPHLVRIYRTTPQIQTGDHLHVDYTDLIPATREFADLAAFRMWGYTLAQEGKPPVNLNALRVSAEFFSVLGMQPALGRVFTKEEDRPGNHVVVLNHETWLTQFGGDPATVGRTVRIDGEPTTIIGVMPASFSSVFLWGPGDVFRPLAATDEERANRDNVGFGIIGRYRAGMSIDQLNARLSTIAERLAPNRPHENSKDGLHAVSLQSRAQPKSTLQITLMLLGLAGFVLLIACANLANLQLARAVARTREFGIRAALGASRRRLLGPMLAESLLLALAGGVCGVLVAVWANDWISSRLSANGFVTFKLVIDWRVLAFALAASLLTGFIFGIVPAWMMSRVNVNETLKSGARGSTGDRVQHRFRHALIIGQFAMALVLLAGAGFFSSGIKTMLSRDNGWASGRILQGVLNLPQTKYPTPDQTYSFYTQLEERLGSLPGVESVSVGWTLPIFQFLASRSYIVEGRDPPAAGHEPIAMVNGVMPSYIDTLKLKLTNGRDFTNADKLGAPPVAIINESMAQALFPNENPIGRRIGSTDASQRNWMEIVGVVSDFNFAVSFAPQATRFMVLRPLAQETWNYVSFAVRSSSPEQLAQPVREAIAAMDPDLAVQQLGSVKQFVSKTMTSSEMITTIMISFAGLGLFLASVGLYGVIARLVAQRAPEIGVRMALGAQPREVVWLVLSSGIKLTLWGTFLGIIGAFLLAQVMATFSPNATNSDYSPLIMATLLLVAVALLASWLPARRAAKVDPMVALRAE